MPTNSPVSKFNGGFWATFLSDAVSSSVDHMQFYSQNRWQIRMEIQSLANSQSQRNWPPSIQAPAFSGHPTAERKQRKNVNVVLLFASI
jgi:hypothetical protein